MEIMTLLIALSLLLNLICIIAICALFQRHDKLLDLVSRGFNAFSSTSDSLNTVMSSVCTVQDTLKELMTHYIEHHRLFHQDEPQSLKDYLH